MNPNIDLSKPDLNIVKSLKEIKWPLKNYDGVLVYINEEKIYHASVKRHYLKVRDIKIIGNVLLNPIKIITHDYRKNKIYFGKRMGTSGNNNYPYIQIVTRKINNKEYIITIYPVKNLNEKIPH